MRERERAREAGGERERNRESETRSVRELAFGEMQSPSR